jgi:hypothetical protein
MTATAAKGTVPLTQAWNAASAVYRRYLTSSAAGVARWKAIKDQAEAVTR